MEGEVCGRKKKGGGKQGFYSSNSPSRTLSGLGAVNDLDTEEAHLC